MNTVYIVCLLACMARGSSCTIFNNSGTINNNGSGYTSKIRGAIRNDNKQSHKNAR